MADKIKLIVAALLVIAGLAAFYYFGEQPGYIKWGVLLVAFVVAAVVFFTTPTGKATWEFIQGSRQEMRKVVWPDRKETVQVTLIVFVMAVLVAVFLWIIDWGLHKILKQLTSA
jgi:preprotein translocase subunit SecE